MISWSAIDSSASGAAYIYWSALAGMSAVNTNNLNIALKEPMPPDGQAKGGAAQAHGSQKRRLGNILDDKRATPRGEFIPYALDEAFILFFRVEVP